MKDKSKIEKNYVPSAFVDTAEYCLLAKNVDFLEVIQWHNGEGFVLHMCKQNTSGDTKDTYLHFTFGEFKAIKKLVNTIKV